jgi:sulfite exporter TauE/SafE
MILLPAIGLGIAGSLHCVGMCGPIALAVPAGKGSGRQKFIAHTLYHIGRISAYTILGFLFGVLGYGISTAGFQQSMSIAAGVFMLLFIWVPKFAGATSVGGKLASVQNRVLGKMSRLIKEHRAQALIGLGFFNGLLPCGLVYLALAGALVSYDPFAGAAFMALFGLGTAPALLALALTGNAIDIRWRSRLRQLAPVLATAIALLFIMRGLGLGIPFLSPEIGHQVAADHICIP